MLQWHFFGLVLQCHFSWQRSIGEFGVDFGVLLFLAGAIFGEVAVMLEGHFSWAGAAFRDMG